MIKDCRLRILAISLFLFIIHHLLIINPVFAHLAGQPPFFKVNDIYSSLYQVPMISLDDFMLPQDIAPQNFLVGEKIDFEIDQSQLPVLPSILGETKFYWDFGDGGVGEGLQQSYTYQKPGSYFLTIKAQYQTEYPQLLQSMLINILPSKDYKLPKAVIKVDKFITKDPLTDFYTARPNSQHTFDANQSDGGGSKITEYTWDFGDGDTGKNSKENHQFQTKYSQVFPVLRIKTADGFIADSFMEIKFDEKATNKGQINPSSPNFFVPVFIGLVIFIIIILVVRRLKSFSK
jgi:hypothetical protein